MFGGTAVLWESSKQIVIAWSIMKTEPIDLDTTYSKAEWLRNLITELPISSLCQLHPYLSTQTEVTMQESNDVDEKLWMKNCRMIIKIAVFLETLFW